MLLNMSRRTWSVFSVFTQSHIQICSWGIFGCAFLISAFRSWSCRNFSSTVGPPSLRTQFAVDETSVHVQFCASHREPFFYYLLSASMELTAMKVNELLDVSCHHVLDGAVDPVASFVGRPSCTFTSPPFLWCCMKMLCTLLIVFMTWDVNVYCSLLTFMA